MQDANAAAEPANKIKGIAGRSEAYCCFKLIQCSISAMNKMPMGK